MTCAWKIHQAPQTAYPCSFEKRAGRSLKGLPRLKQCLGSWRKVRKLGDAYFGKVFLASGTAPDSTPLSAFALKVMPRSRVLEGGPGLESACNELHAALALRELALPGAAEVYFAAQDDEYFYLATEYCPHGELLAVVQKAGRFSSEALLREVMAQVLSGLEALHAAGVAHRDISLENLLVTASGRVRLIDFGQALLVHAPGDLLAEEPVHASPSCLPGKAAYRAPELADGSAPYLAKKVDMYAVGVVLYTLAVGRYPIQQDLYSGGRAEADRCYGLGASLEKQGLSECVAPGLLDFLEQLLAPGPTNRPSAKEALAHPWVSGACEGDYNPAPAEEQPGVRAVRAAEAICPSAAAGATAVVAAAPCFDRCE